MAGREPSISRRRVLGAAAVLPVSALIPAPALAGLQSHALWERRLAHYYRAVARAEEAATTGWFRAANDRHYRDVAEIEARFGDWKAAQRSPEGAALCKAIWRRMDGAEDAYWKRCSGPLQRAAVALALTPAPDLEALRVKITVMRAQEQEPPDWLERHPFEVLAEDLGRL
jgi:hypothetical protein